MKTVVIASVLLLGVFGCDVSSDTRDDVDESGEPAVSESAAESELLVCGQWFCVAVKPQTECEGFGIDSSQGRCNSEALHDCTTRCGGTCVIESVTCDSP